MLPTVEIENFYPLKYFSRTILESKTNEVQNKAPFKPDFDYRILAERYSYPELKITWLPCGKEDDCNSSFAGAYFYVKYE